MINDTLHHQYIDKNTGTLDSKTMAQRQKTSSDGCGL